MSTQPVCFSPYAPMVEKLAFRSKAKAVKHVRRLPGSYRHGSVPYLCRTCGLWHLTSKPTRLH